MNIDNILKFFVPKDHSFFPLFEEGAHNLVKAAELLNELMCSSDPGVHEKINSAIKNIEHIGDEITVKTYIQLDKSFITPFDREDIHELTSNIDDIVDSINRISRRVCLYKPKHLTPVYGDMTRLILIGAREIEQAVCCLNDPIKNQVRITEACNRITLTEQEADEIYYAGIAELFSNEDDTKELLKNNKIMEQLERCVNEEEDVTDTLKAILLKMA